MQELDFFSPDIKKAKKDKCNFGIINTYKMEKKNKQVL